MRAKFTVVFTLFLVLACLLGSAVVHSEDDDGLVSYLLRTSTDLYLKYFESDVEDDLLRMEFYARFRLYHLLIARKIASDGGGCISEILADIRTVRSDLDDKWDELKASDGGLKTLEWDDIIDLRLYLNWLDMVLSSLSEDISWDIDMGEEKRGLKKTIDILVFQAEKFKMDGFMGGKFLHKINGNNSGSDLEIYTMVMVAIDSGENRFDILNLLKSSGLDTYRKTLFGKLSGVLMDFSGESASEVKRNWGSKGWFGFNDKYKREQIDVEAVLKRLGEGRASDDFLEKDINHRKLLDIFLKYGVKSDPRIK